MLFCDNSGDTVHFNVLPLLEDFEVAGRYSWGSAALGFLYSQLTEASKKTTSRKGSMGGFATFLQIWIWNTFPLLQPKFAPSAQNIKVVETRSEYLTYSSPWLGKCNKAHQKEMKYVEYTVLLDDMTYMDYKWYDDKGYTKLHPLCFEDKKVWESKTSSIYFWIKQPHNVDLVARQFGKRTIMKDSEGKESEGCTQTTL